uniref:AAA+ ATPase domain-containing protein n=1 Tax=viral metagenome TaxID=1070528 RepID=A0A6C0KTT6_9ZZZZ
MNLVIDLLDNENSKNNNEKCENNENCENNFDKRQIIDNLVKKINYKYDNGVNYNFDYKEMLKYKSEKYNDPNRYIVSNNYKINNRFLINRALKASREEARVIPKIVKKELITINADINNIGDLIKLIDENPLDDNKEYNINMSSLHKSRKYLVRLNEMIGMKELKESILDQILYFIQDLHKDESDKMTNDFMHTVIYGPPGTGKTEVAKIMGKLFSKMDILKKETFKKVTRADLIAGYLGQTAQKTKDVITGCLGGVLFIDEAYSLGNSEKRDSFSKECIDTLCEALSDHKDNLMVIIAGYESELKESFFSYNPGLESRFNWRFKTGGYTGKELYEIFVKKVNKIGWTIDKDIDIKWFEKNAVYFKFYGRDVETLLSKAKISHSRRIFCKSSELKKVISKKDLENGFENFLKIEEVKNRKEESDNSKRIGMLYI